MNLLSRVARIWEYRGVMWILVKRDLRVRYARSVLGYLWTLIDPLAMTLVYWFVFDKIYGMKSETRSEGIPFVLFMVAGILAWNWFNMSVNETARALYAERLLVRSTNLPREMWVIRVVLSKGIEHLMSLPILIVFTTWFWAHGQVHLNIKLLLWIPALILELILCIGVGLVMAPVTALIDDFVRVVRIVLRMGFYFTPIVYSLQFLEEKRSSLHWLARVLEFNPLTAINDLYRQGMLTRATPDYHIWLIGLVVSLAWLVFGMWIFAKLEKPILKEI
ncbi:ABC transporter permease [Rudaeicoccus suwonensis]|uniref:Transport permease protein n=1 Tax=Rudaeicoccus suwonensis TaxID=657409 RepID=A0A561E913_9MICO|nr:ABC transporter permease [Rudaeicoccus suwonensis]TWE12099.1 ABC-2 type transport system permease protein [Rudaeicoccus suwonensis]